MLLLLLAGVCWGDEAATGGYIILFVSSNDCSISKMLLLSIVFIMLSKNEELELGNPHEKQNQVT